MKVLAILSSSDDVTPPLQRIIQASNALSSSYFLTTNSDSAVNRAFYAGFVGRKAYFSSDKQPDCGHPLHVNPASNPFMRKFAMTKVKGFMKLTKQEKSVALNTLACLYGLEATVDSPFQPKMVLTYSTCKEGSYKRCNQRCCLAINIAKDNGFKVLNLADSKATSLFVNMLKKVRDNERLRNQKLQKRHK